MLPLRVTPLFLALASPLLADRLDPAVVDSRARVLVHLDVQALKATELYRLVRADFGPKLDEALEDFEQETGLNPLEDLRGVTLYATDVSQDRWIALLHTTSRIDEALQGLRRQPGYSESQVGDKTIHSFVNDDEHWYGHLFLGQGDQRLFAISEDSGALVEAIGVVDGERSGLDDAGEPFVASQPSQGAVLFVSAATDRSELADFDPSAELSRLVRGVLFECGESQGTFYSSLRITTGDQDDALKIQQVIDGGLALGKLVLTRAEEAQGLSELLEALEVQRTGTVVTLSFRYASRALYDGLRAASMVGLELERPR